MNCPKCGTSDFYEGLNGPNCLNINCKNFKNGGTSTYELEETLGCDGFDKNVTKDHKDLAEEMTDCILNCNLDRQEQIHYTANILADLIPNYRRK